MSYTIKRWPLACGGSEAITLTGCDRLEVVKQAISAIDFAQNFEATIEEPNKEG